MSFNKIILTLFMSLFATNCATNNKQFEQFDNMTKMQADSLTPKQKEKLCIKLEDNKDQHKKRATNIIWQLAKNRKDNKISYNYISKNWLGLITTKDTNIFGKDFRQIQSATLLNIRYGVNLQCGWVNDVVI